MAVGRATSRPSRTGRLPGDDGAVGPQGPAGPRCSRPQGPQGPQGPPGQAARLAVMFPDTPAQVLAALITVDGSNSTRMRTPWTGRR